MTQTGQLRFGYNDGFVKLDRSALDGGAVGDNSGQFTLNITIIRGTSRESALGVIRNFMSRRADQITANDPDLVERLTRRGAADGSGLPLGFAASGTADHFRLAFSTSLSEIVGAGEGAEVGTQGALNQVIAYGANGPAGNPESSQYLYGDQGGGQSGDPGLRFDVWAEGKWAHVDDETRESDLGLLYVGADYLINPSLLVGFLGQIVDRRGILTPLVG